MKCEPQGAGQQPVPVPVPVPDDDGSGALSPWTLRFASAGVESAYCSQHVDSALRPSVVFSHAASQFVPFLALGLAAHFRPPLSDQCSADLFAVCALGAVVASAVVSLSISLFSWRRAALVAQELLVCFVCSASALATLAGSLRCRPRVDSALQQQQQQQHSSSSSPSAQQQQQMINYDVPRLLCSAMSLTASWAFLFLGCVPWPRVLVALFLSLSIQAAALLAAFLATDLSTGWYQPAAFIGAALFDALIARLMTRERKSEYAAMLLTERGRRQTAVERARTDAIVDSLFPSEVAKKLMQERVEAIRAAPALDSVGEPLVDNGEPTIFAEKFDCVALIAVIVGVPEGEKGEELATLSKVLTAIEYVASKNCTTRVSSNGFCFVFASGLREEKGSCARNACSFATEVQQSLWALSTELGKCLYVSIGIATGPAVAGVINVQNPRYDVWSYIVPVADRLAHTACVDQILVTRDVAKKAGSHFDIKPMKERVDVCCVGSIDGSCSPSTWALRFPSADLDQAFCERHIASSLRPAVVVSYTAFQLLSFLALALAARFDPPLSDSCVGDAFAYCALACVVSTAIVAFSMWVFALRKGALVAQETLLCVVGIASGVSTLYGFFWCGVASPSPESHQPSSSHPDRSLTFDVPRLLGTALSLTAAWVFIALGCVPWPRVLASLALSGAFHGVALVAGFIALGNSVGWYHPAAYASGCLFNIVVAYLVTRDRKSERPRADSDSGSALPVVCYVGLACLAYVAFIGGIVVIAVRADRAAAPSTAGMQDNGASELLNVSGAVRGLPPPMRLFNPSPVIDWRPRAERSGSGVLSDPSELLVCYRWVERFNQRSLRSYVLLRWHSLGGGPLSHPPAHSAHAPMLSYAPSLARGTSGPMAFLDVLGRPCNASEEVGCGFEDARGLVLPGGELVLVTNGPFPTSGHRRMSLFRFPLWSVLPSLVPGNGVARGGPVVPQGMRMNWLAPPGANNPTRWEKNWMPFVNPSDKRLLFVYSVEPHVIVHCDLDSEPGVNGSACAVVANTSWPGLLELLGTKGRALRGSTAVVDRGPGLDFVACAHWVFVKRKKKVRGLHYWHMCYTFSRDYPWAITGSTKPFRFGDVPLMQYVSGLSLAGSNWYMMSYSIEDDTQQTLMIPRDTFDTLLQALRRPSTADSSSSGDD
eukprot:m51a1_g2039 putative adenylate cyclase (1167) ;mRNA; r:1345539-1354750